MHYNYSRTSVIVDDVGSAGTYRRPDEVLRWRKKTSAFMTGVTKCGEAEQVYTGNNASHTRAWAPYRL